MHNTDKTTNESLTPAEVVIYSLKAAIAAYLSVVALKPFNFPGAIWAPVSAVIVTQAGLHPSVQAALVRIAANFVGAFVGALCLSALRNTPAAMALAVLITGIVCHFGKMGDAAKSAFAAVVIVTLSSEPKIWAGSMERVFGVMLGCVIALLVGLAFDLVTRLKWFKPVPHRRHRAAHKPSRHSE